MTSTLVGAGVVAFASSSVPDLKTHVVAYEGGDRASEADRASRDYERSAEATTLDQGSLDLWQLPVRNYATSSKFGWRLMGGYNEFHAGYDMQCPEGTPIYAPFDGTVELAEWYAGYGYAIIIDHGNGLKTLYGHQSRLIAQQGQVVRAGEEIGRSGNTGYSTGPHVHFEVRLDGVALDPYQFMLKRGVDLDRQIEVVNGGTLK